jgi:hypothetical protein
MPGMDANIPDSTAPGGEGGDTTTFSPLQRLLAGIALLALLASAAISSWWILDGQVDFVDSLAGVPPAVENSAEAQTPPNHPGY